MSLRSMVLGCCLLAGAYSLSACGDDDGGDDSGSSGDAGPSGHAGSGNAGSGNAGSGHAGSGSAGRGGSGNAGSGNAGSGNAGSGTGSGDDTLIADLSASDVEELCGQLDAELSDTVSEDDAARLSCTLLALFTSLGNGQSAVDRAECEQAVTDCLNSGLGEGMTTMTCDTDTLQSAAEGCTTTVAEYSACLHASVEQLGMALDAFTCETLSDEETAQAALAMGDQSSLPECAAIEEECPALLEGGGSSGTPSESGCEDTCTDNIADDFCDDGGPGSDFSLCPLGTDCTDCGPRQ